MTKLEDRPWWPELVGLKDVLSLRELSERFGAAPAAISNALKRNNLDRRAAPPGPRANRDPELQKRAKDALQSGTAKKPGRKPASAPVAAPASKAAKEAPRKGAAAKVDAGRSKLDEYRPLLGKKIDREIADMAGLSVSAVTNYRKRYGIPAASRGGRRPKAASAAPAPVTAQPSAVPQARAAAPAARPAATPSAGLTKGFRVQIGTTAYVVLANDIAEAARVAQEAKRGSVERIELLGDALRS